MKADIFQRNMRYNMETVLHRSPVKIKLRRWIVWSLEIARRRMDSVLKSTFSKFQTRSWAVLWSKITCHVKHCKFKTFPIRTEMAIEWDEHSHLKVNCMRWVDDWTGFYRLSSNSQWNKRNRQASLDHLLIFKRHSLHPQGLRPLWHSKVILQ